jgi:hypothetical protein
MDADALLVGGIRFLTDAFRRFGALPADNRVTGIGQYDEVAFASLSRTDEFPIQVAES